MTIDSNCTKSLLSPPGDTIQETLTEFGMSGIELGVKINMNIQNVSDLIKGIMPIDFQIANQLEKVLKIPASFWTNREKEYRLELQKMQEDKTN